MGIRISSLSANALPYTGRELIPLVQNTTTRAGTLSSFVNYLSGDFAFVNRSNTFLGSQTIQGNLSVQRTLSATTVEAVSAKFDFVDIKQFESSGFDVRGDLNVVGRLSATNNVTFNSGLTAGNTVLFDVNTSTPALEIVQRGVGHSLLVKDESGDITPFTVSTDGKVGIGTSTPNEALTVVGNISATGNTTFIGGVTGSNPIVIDVTSSIPALDITQRGPGAVVLIKDVFSDTTPFAIDGAGNVGIGTSTPNQALTVFGNLSVSGSLSATLIEAVSSRITYLDIREYELSGFRATGPVIIETDSANTTLRITQSGTGDVIRVEDSVNPDTTPFIVKSDGKVGIGVTDPNEKLTVVGNISAAGSIYAVNTISTPTGDSTKWDNTYTTVNSNSANWNRGYTAFNGMTSLSANWQNSYSTVNANSATTWNYQGTDLKNLSSGWVGGNSAFTTVNANSASWNTSTVSDNNNTTVTLALADAYNYIRLTNTSPITISIPVLSWAIGTTITFRRTTGAGAVSLSLAGGITVNDDDTVSIGPGDVFGLKYISSNTWDFI